MFVREAAYIPVSLARQYGTVRGLRRLQLRGLNAALAHAVSQVPYYRDRAAYPRHRLADLAAFGRLPLLEKQQLRELPQSEFLAGNVDPRRCHRFRTSGTTGQRVEIMHDRRNHDYENATMMRRFLATGRYLPSYRISHVRPLPIPTRGYQRFGLFRREVILTSLPVSQWRDMVVRNRPQVLIGYPVHLRTLLRELTAQELAQLRRRLRMVMTESELLVDTHRAALVEGFGVPVFDEYSTFETLHIYFECARGGRHIAEDRVLLEVVGEDGHPVPDGQEGRIVCTAFHERAMPLLRYAVGDTGVIDPEPCECGRRFRTMRLTRGRVNDSIVLPDGRRIFADRFLVIAGEQPGVAELHVRQDAAGAVQVQVVPDGTVPPARVLGDIREVVLAEAGQSLPLEVVQVARVPLTAAGKGRFVHSEYVAG